MIYYASSHHILNTSKAFKDHIKLKRICKKHVKSWTHLGPSEITPNVWIDFVEITLAKLCVRTCCTMRSRRHESSSSSRSIIFFFQDEELGWTDDGTDDNGWRDGWMERTTLSGQNQVYYIRRYRVAAINTKGEKI
jgi:hypothetical protein